MYTTHESQERIVSRESTYALSIGFSPSSAYQTSVPNQYDHVKLNSDGTIDPCAAVTDKPIGYVASAYERTAGGKGTGQVRVLTGFKALMRVECDGTLTPGDEVSISGIDASGTYDAATLNKAKTSVSTNYVVGICLNGGLATTCEALIGIFQNAYLKP